MEAGDGYAVILSPSAERDIKAMRRIPKHDSTAIREAVLGLADDPRPPGSIKLAGEEAHRIRVGNYRIIYGIDDEARRVTVMWIGDRKDAY